MLTLSALHSFSNEGGSIPFPAKQPKEQYKGSQEHFMGGYEQLRAPMSGYEQSNVLGAESRFTGIIA